jgi:Na+/H+ antiporter NhaA
MMPLAEIVDWQALLETGIAAFVAGVGVAFTVSLTILGAARSAESSREGRSGHATAYALVGVLGFTATAAAIVAGIIVMAS